MSAASSIAVPFPVAPGFEAKWWARAFRALRLRSVDPRDGSPDHGGDGVASERPEDPDEPLLDRIREGFPHQTQAFTELVERHWNRAWTVCQAVLLNSYDSEEAAQETFLKVHRYLPSFRGESRFTTWLGRIAHRTAIDHLRSRRRERDLRETVQWDPSLGHGFIPAAARRDGPDVQRLRSALAELSPEDRSLLILRDMEGHPYEEIAQMLSTKQISCSKSLAIT